MLSLVGKTKRVPITLNISINFPNCLLILLRLIFWITMPVSFLSRECFVVSYPRLGCSGAGTTGCASRLGCSSSSTLLGGVLWRHWPSVCWFREGGGGQSPLFPGNLIPSVIGLSPTTLPVPMLIFISIPSVFLHLWISGTTFISAAFGRFEFRPILRRVFSIIPHESLYCPHNDRQLVWR